jgi:hypothetical protein
MNRMKRPAMAEKSRQPYFHNVRREQPTFQPYSTDLRTIVIPEMDEGSDPSWCEVGRIHRGSRIRGHAL